MIYLISCVFFLSIFLLWQIPKWQLNNKKYNEAEEKKISLENELRKTAAQIIGGLLVLIGLGFTYEQISATKDTIDISQERLKTDRYSKAIDQLGSDNPQVRLGGIFALEKISESSPDYASVITKVLATYIRQKSHSNDSTVFEELQAAIDIISYKDNHENYERDRIREINISNVRLRKFDFNNSLLKNAKMIASDFSESNFVNANLTRVTAYEASFFKTNLTNANLSNSNFYGGNFEQAIFVGSILENVNFQLADLKEADFSNCDLSGVDLTDADLTGTKLLGANLLKTIGLTKEQVRSARVNNYTKISSDLN